MGERTVCGRYYVDETLGTEIRELVYSMEKRLVEHTQEFSEELGTSSRDISGGKSILGTDHIAENMENSHLSERDIQSVKRVGDIYPSELAEIICMNQKRVDIRTMRWGFPGETLMINARAETLLERPMFKDSARYRRCLVPARKYYEWNSQKEKATFSHLEGAPLYMAGIYDLHKGEECFVIITTEANLSVSPVHHRMPLILEHYEAEIWLKNMEAAGKLLRKTPGTLQCMQEYEQMNLWFLTNHM